MTEFPQMTCERRFDDGLREPMLIGDENIEPRFVGLAVDYYLSRLKTGAYPSTLFNWALRLEVLSYEDPRWNEVSDLMSSLYRGVVDDSAIAAACVLVRYTEAFLHGAETLNSNAQTLPDERTTAHIQRMVDRCIPFFWAYSTAVTRQQCIFPGGYKHDEGYSEDDLIAFGGNWGSSDDEITLWDMDVSDTPPSAKHVEQLLVAWRGGFTAAMPRLAPFVTHLGVFNPRLNEVYRLQLADIRVDLIGQADDKAKAQGWFTAREEKPLPWWAESDSN
ncbi:MAG: hypothetical protein ACOYBP_07445 [Microbacteriaceae bacterium]